VTIPLDEISEKDPLRNDKVSPPNRNSFSLDKLRSELTDSQQKYLNLFWEHYLDYGQWPTLVEFHRDNEIEDVHESLRTPPLNGGIVMEQTGGGDERYELTLVGILLTKDGKHYEEMRIRLLEFLSKKYFHPNKEERKNRYSDEEIAEEIKLGVEDMKILGKVGGFDNIYRTSGGSTVGGHWSIEFPRKEIQSIPRKGPFADYHEKIVSQQYYPEWKVFIEDRHAAQRVVTFPKGVFSEAFNPLVSSDTHSSEQDDAPLLTPVPVISSVNDPIVGGVHQVFVGSSSEAKATAKALIRDLANPKLNFRPWWDNVRPGRMFLSELEHMSKEASAALFLFTPDIDGWNRGKKTKYPNQNVLFELGYFLGHFRPDRIAIIRYGETEMPSDLSGHTHIKGSKFFKAKFPTTTGKATKKDFLKWVSAL
jgi:hypothetical protein